MSLCFLNVTSHSLMTFCEPIISLFSHIVIYNSTKYYCIFNDNHCLVHVNKVSNVVPMHMGKQRYSANHS